MNQNNLQNVDIQQKIKVYNSVIDDIIGMEQIKHNLLGYIFLRKVDDNFIIAGNPGTGKTLLAKKIGQLFCKLGLLEQGQLIYARRVDLVGECIGQTPQKVKGVLEKAVGGVLYIDEAYTLIRDEFGREALAELIALMEQYKGKLVVVLSVYKKDIEEFLECNSGLNCHLKVVQIENYTAEEMEKILNLYAQKDSIVFSDTLKEKLPTFCENWLAFTDENWQNAREAINLLRDMCNEWIKDPKHEVIPNNGKELKLLDVRHIPDRYKGYLQPVSNMEELLFEIEDSVYHDTSHFIITGASTMDRITVAKKIGQILKKINYLHYGNLIQVNSSDIISEYIGQTGMKVKKQVDTAIGNVLFIDNIDSLLDSEFGQEAVDSLLDLIFQRRGEFTLVIGVNSNEMDSFLKFNPALASWFKVINIEEK